MLEREQICQIVVIINWKNVPLEAVETPQKL